jgi:hypothetical protein
LLLLAGKSNLMDAISFVLGLSSKTIRAEKLKDLIFRVEGSSAPVSAAPARAIDNGPLSLRCATDLRQRLRPVAGFWSLFMA